MTDLDAHLRLTVAIDQLVQPGRQQLHRADPIADTLAAAQHADERQADHELTARHAHYLKAGYAAQATRTMTQLLDHRRRVTARREAVELTSTAAELPSLLKQLRDAVATSTNTGDGGNSKTASHRQAIGLAAAELLHGIERTIGRGDPTERARAWAAGDHTDADAAATLAESWVEQGRGILDPPRRWSHPGACPACGCSVAHAQDDTGEVVRRPALELDRAKGTVRCLRCSTRWTTEAQLRALERAISADLEAG